MDAEPSIQVGNTKYINNHYMQSEQELKADQMHAQHIHTPISRLIEIE